MQVLDHDLNNLYIYITSLFLLLWYWMYLFYALYFLKILFIFISMI